MRVKVAEQMVLTVNFNRMRNNALRIHDDEPRDYSLELISVIQTYVAAKNPHRTILEDYVEIPKMIQGESKCISLRS
ncbi:MAG: hypothetical protein B6U65_04605 [Candidatus Wolframiiraptor sp. EX4484-121]|nr:MAG: hypothetical protein B6U65_04605 [Candidatus Wolframiiraptor sp. EX4484-121]